MNLKIKKGMSNTLMELYISLMFCFGYLFNNYALAVIGLIFVVFNLSMCKQKFLLHKYYYPIIIGILIWGISALFSSDSGYALKYVFYCLCLLLIFGFMNLSSYEKIFDFMFIFTGIHVFFIILQAFFFNFVDGIAYRILSETQYHVVHSIYSWSGALAGITGQTATAALYCVVFLSIIVIKAMTNKTWYILALAPLIGILLTQKRAFLLVSIIDILIIEMQQMKKEKIRKRLWLIITIMVMVFILYNITTKYVDVTGIINKIQRGSTSNRDVLWKEMIQIINKNFWFGKGLFSTNTILGMTGHNIYLQLLCENGIIGAVPFFCFFVYVTYLVFKYKNNNINICFANFQWLFILGYGILGNPIYEFSHIILFFISYDIIMKNKIDYDKNRGI